MKTGTAQGRRIWWSTWPAAIGMGLVSLAMVAFTAVGLFLTALLTPPASGTDLTTVDTPATAWRVVWAIAGAACLALPIAAIVAARRRWLGWLLVVLGISAFVLAAGLWALGIL